MTQSGSSWTRKAVEPKCSDRNLLGRSIAKIKHRGPLVTKKWLRIESVKHASTDASDALLEHVKAVYVMCMRLQCVFNDTPQSRRSHPPGARRTPPRSRSGCLAPGIASAVDPEGGRTRRTPCLGVRRWGNRIPMAIRTFVDLVSEA